jgi:hypothetical protein
MLPDFPRIKRHVRNTTSRVVRELVRRHPTLGEIQSRPVFEGNRTGIKDEDSKRDTPMEEVAIPALLDRHAIIEKGVNAVHEQLPLIASKMIGAQIGMLLRVADAAVEHTGNKVDAAGAPFSQEHYLQMLQTVQMEFDDDGTPHMPSPFHPDPAVQSRIEARLSQWAQDSTFRARLEAVIAKQRQDWNDRESDRKLVE